MNKYVSLFVVVIGLWIIFSIILSRSSSYLLYRCTSSSTPGKSLIVFIHSESVIRVSLSVSLQAHYNDTSTAWHSHTLAHMLCYWRRIVCFLYLVDFSGFLSELTIMIFWWSDFYKWTTDLKMREHNQLHMNMKYYLL